MSVEIVPTDDIQILAGRVESLENSIDRLADLLDRQQQDQPEWMKVKDVAEILGLKPDTIRRRAHAGMYVNKYDGKFILIHRDSVFEKRR